MHWLLQALLFSNRIPLTHQQYGKNITLTLKISTILAKQILLEPKRGWSKMGNILSAKEIFSKANQLHTGTGG